MSTESYGSLHAILHMAHVMGPQHLADKEAFSKGFLGSEQVIKIQIPCTPPEAKLVRQLMNQWNEPQRCFRFTEEGVCDEVKGQDLADYLVQKGLHRRKKYYGNGSRKLADGRIVERDAVKRKNNEPLRIETTTLSSWDTELLNAYADSDVFAELMRIIVKRYEDVTGRKVLGANWHLDTQNYHLDIISTDLNELLGPIKSVIGKTGVWKLPHGTVVDLRYDRDGFPVESSTLESEKATLAFHEKKEGFQAIRNLETGFAADDWIREWAQKKELAAERLKLRRRFEDFAKKKIAAVARIKEAAGLLASSAAKLDRKEAPEPTVPVEKNARAADDLRPMDKRRKKTNDEIEKTKKTMQRGMHKKGTIRKQQR